MKKSFVKKLVIALLLVAGSVAAKEVFTPETDGSDYFVYMRWSGLVNPCSSPVTRVLISANRTGIFDIQPAPLFSDRNAYPYAAGPGMQIDYEFQAQYTGIFNCNQQSGILAKAVATEPLRPPLNVTASYNSSFSSISVTWTKSLTDVPPAQYSYRVYKNSVLMITVASTKLSWTDSNADTRMDNTYRVVTYAASWNKQSAGGTVTVKEPARIAVTPASLTPSAVVGTDAADQIFTISNVGGSGMDYTVVEDLTWLSVDVNGGALDTGAFKEVTVRYSSKDLTLSGSPYTGDIRIASDAASNQAIYLPVTLTITPPQYTIRASVDANGTITPSGYVMFTEGDSARFDFTPNTGYYVYKIVVDDVGLSPADHYTFYNVKEEHTIEAQFRPITYIITAVANTGGSISPAGDVSVNYGGSKAFTVTPSAGYEIEKLHVDGASVSDPTGYTFSNVTADHDIEAFFSLKTYTITATAGSNGSISPAGNTQVNHGASRTYTITPSSGFAVADVKVDGASQGSITSYTFQNVTGGHSISATFTAATVSHTITATAGANGSISPSGNVTVNEGSNITFTISPDTDFEVADLVVDGTSQGPKPSWTFNDVQTGHTISATFQLKPYIITATAGSNGSISPSGAVEVDNGQNQTFTFTPSTGYEVGEVIVDGASVGKQTSYQFSGVTANHSISVTFVPKQYGITLTVGANGSVSPFSSTGPVMVRHGEDQIFSITPDSGYAVADVLVDGSSVGAVTSYAFTGVTQAHSLTVSFSAITHIWKIIAGAGANGSISPADTVAINEGLDITFNMYPVTGYEVANVLVDGSSAGAVTSYTFTDVAADHTISVSFAKKSFIITASAGENGAITPSGATAVTYGGSQTYTITPSSGFAVDDVLVNGASVGAVTEYIFSDVTANQSIEASFTAITVSRTITATADSGGSVAPSGAVSVNQGGNITFRYTPDSGFEADSVFVDGVGAPADSAYAFSNVQSDHTLRVSFKPEAFTITTSAGSNGRIDPAGVTTAQSGDDRLFSIIADSGYVVADVMVDGSSLGAVTSHAFNNITANHTISATFEAITTLHTINASVSGSGGSISPESDVQVNEGNDITFTITPENGYLVSDVLVDGSSVGSVSSYSFTNVTTDHTIAVSFSQTNYQPGFSSSPVVTAAAGSLYTYSAAAADQNGTDVLTFSLVAGPSGMTVDAATGAVSWTPGEADAGEHQVILQVSDGRGGTDLQLFRVTVVSLTLLEAEQIDHILPGADQTAYGMFSFPYYPDPLNLSTLIGNNFGTKDITEWRVFKYNNGVLFEYPNLGSVVPGEAYWLITGTTRKIDAGIQALVTSDLYDQLTVPAGEWKLIGSPFPFNVTWQEVLNATSNSDQLSSLWKFDAGWQEVTGGELEPFGGYAVKNKSLSTIRLVIPRKPAGSGKAASAAGFFADAVISFRTGCDGSRDDYTCLGWSGAAADGYDRSDRVEPLIMDAIPYVAAYFDHADWSTPDKYSADIRSLDGNGETWQLTVESNRSGKMARIDWNVDRAKVPAGMETWLYDPSGGVAVNMEEYGGYTIANGTGTTVRKLDVYVGTPDYISDHIGLVRGLPGATMLNHASGNPFKGLTGMTYQLTAPQASHRVAVYGADGSVVRVLAAGPVNAGYHTVHWDGRDADGRQAGPGVYYVVLSAEGVLLTKAVVKAE